MVSLLEAIKALDLTDRVFNKIRYQGRRPNPLHFAFFYADWHAVRLLTEICPEMVFWSDENQHLPPMMTSFTFNPVEEEKCVLVTSLGFL